MHQGALKACLDLATSSFESESVTTHPLPPLGAADHVMIKGSIHISDKQNASVNVKTNNHSPHSNNCNNSTHWHWTNYNTSSLRSPMAELSLTPMRDPSNPKPVTTFLESLAVSCPTHRYLVLQHQPQSSTKKLTPSNSKGPTWDLARTTKGDQGETQATSQVLTDPGTRALARIRGPTKPINILPSKGQVRFFRTSPYIKPTSAG